MEYYSSSNEKKMQWVQCYCWFYDFLSSAQKNLFLSLLDDFIGEIKFEGKGIEITDEMRVAVGGWAVLLVLNIPLGINLYRHVDVVFIHPNSEVKENEAIGLLVGVSQYCHIHLAWMDIRDSTTKSTNNRNTILHEFAHALDRIDRVTNGSPTVILPKRDLHKWEKVFNVNYLSSKPAKQRNILWEYFELYDLTEPESYDLSREGVAELFAISTEKYFESPKELRLRSPEIYKCLLKLYKFDSEQNISKNRKMSSIILNWMKLK